MGLHPTGLSALELLNKTRLLRYLGCHGHSGLGAHVLRRPTPSAAAAAAATHR